MKKINLHIYPSTFKFESRILKITETIVNNGIVDEVIIIALPGTGLPDLEIIDSRRKILRPNCWGANFNKSKFRSALVFVQWTWRILTNFGNKETFMVNSHSVKDLPIGLILKWITGCKLIYDTHELETESNGLKGFKKILFKQVEKLCVRQADFIFTVSESINNWYKEKYSLNNVQVIKNIPKANRYVENQDIFRIQFKIPDKHIIFLYQGALINGRGIPIILEVFSKVDQSRHVIFMGYGPNEELIKDASELHSNIHFYPAVPPDEVLKYTTSADIGLCLIENICLSYFYSLPNKLFEYSSVGLPSIVSRFPEMSRFIESYNCGWTANINQTEIIELISSISLEDLEIKKTLLKDNPIVLDWSSEEKKLVDSYKKILK